MCQRMVAKATLQRHRESLNNLIMEDCSKHEGQKDTDALGLIQSVMQLIGLEASLLNGQSQHSQVCLLTSVTHHCMLQPIKPCQ